MANRHNRKRRSSGGGSGRDSGGNSGRDSGGNSGHNAGGSGSSGPNQSTGRSSPPSKRTKPTQSTETPCPVIVLVSNIHTDATPKDIKKFFEGLKGVGRFDWFRCYYNRNGNFKGKAEVAYRQVSDAGQAMFEINCMKEPLTAEFKIFPNGEPEFPSETESEETCKGKGKKRRK